ncbi:hypothetical protein Q8F55_001741 [Vanrija albida]|uniref:CxC5 like cysteine cluster associated with KDZ domain-containing protein n=1 Tax=Vanrija albida TaxID=181172 RepID=A0ABR3Q7T0_9TREE
MTIDIRTLPDFTRALPIREITPRAPAKCHYGDRRRGAFPFTAGVPESFARSWRANGTVHDVSPVIHVDQHVYNSHLRHNTGEFTGFLMDPAVVHAALHPRFAVHLPFLEPLEFLTGPKGQALMQQFTFKRFANAAFNKLRNGGDSTAEFFENFARDIPCYIKEPKIQCDGCIRRTSGSDDDMPCPCVLVNLGRLNAPRADDRGVTAYVLKCFACGERGEPCTFSLAQGAREFQGVTLFARVVRNPRPDMALREMIWWKDQRYGVDVVPIPPAPIDTSGSAPGTNNGNGVAPAASSGDPSPLDAEESNINNVAPATDSTDPSAPSTGEINTNGVAPAASSSTDTSAPPVGERSSHPSKRRRTNKANNVNPSAKVKKYKNWYKRRRPAKNTWIDSRQWGDYLRLSTPEIIAQSAARVAIAAQRDVDPITTALVTGGLLPTQHEEAFPSDSAVPVASAGQKRKRSPSPGYA